jgi:hypothetical protein
MLLEGVGRGGVFRIYWLGGLKGGDLWEDLDVDGRIISGGWKPEGKRPLGRPRRRWEDNLRRDLREIGVEGDWILLAQDRALVN